MIVDKFPGKDDAYGATKFQFVFRYGERAVRLEKAGVGMSSVRVLVVEDFEPFRRFVCSMMGDGAELQVICEVADGLEAVRKAEELQPDLILLDIGLPTLNGIEVARRIRKLSPNPGYCSSARSPLPM